MADTENSYDECLERLKAKFSCFIMEAESGKNNKSSALRSRKLTMELRSDLKDFRIASTTNDRSNTKLRGATEDVTPEDLGI